MIQLLIFTCLFLQSQGDIVIKDEWMRPNGKGMTTALYFNIENTGKEADTLYKVEFELAEKVEFHESYEKDDMMGMRAVKHIVIPPQSTFILKPGSFHIMLIGLKRDIKNGNESEVTLFFKKAGELKIKAVAKEMQTEKKEQHH